MCRFGVSSSMEAWNPLKFRFQLSIIWPFRSLIIIKIFEIWMFTLYYRKSFQNRNLLNRTHARLHYGRSCRLWWRLKNLPCFPWRPPSMDTLCRGSGILHSDLQSRSRMLYPRTPVKRVKSQCWVLQRYKDFFF